MGPECEPERIVFVHVEDSRYTDESALCLGNIKAFVVEETVKLVFVKVGKVFLVLDLTDTAFTSVSGDELPSA